MVSMFDLIFLTILVAFIVSRLYSVFGSHGGSKNLRIIVKPLDEKAQKNLLKIVEEEAGTADEAKSDANTDSASLSETDKALAAIPAFDKDIFLRGACRVFGLILQAFSDGELEKIRSLVSKKVFDTFAAAELYRAENNLSAEVDFICFDKCEIKNVKLLKNSIKITVEFISEQVNILRNDKDEVVEGDENFVQKITDIWTFERSIHAKSNNWTLVSTKKNA